MDTTTTTLKDLGTAVARVQGDGVYLTGTGFLLWAFIVVVIVLVGFAVTATK